MGCGDYRGKANEKSNDPKLVPKLCLGTHCIEALLLVCIHGNVAIVRVLALVKRSFRAVRSQAELGNETRGGERNERQKNKSGGKAPHSK